MKVKRLELQFGLLNLFSPRISFRLACLGWYWDGLEMGGYLEYGKEQTWGENPQLT